MRSHRLSAGFTLLEIIISIAILGIVAGMVGIFIRGPIDAYMNTQSRAYLTDEADNAIRRMRRDIQGALPNSFRIPGGSTQCFEFLPIVASGRYRVQANNGGVGDTLNFAATDGSFDALTQAGLETLTGTNHVVISNLNGNDVYAGTNRAQISAATPPSLPGLGGAAARVTLQANFQFPAASASNRFQVVPNAAVVYTCANNAIYRITRPLNAAVQACPAPALTDPVLVGDVDCAQSGFVFVPAITVRAGLMEIVLTLTARQESIRLYERVGVSNAP